MSDWLATINVDKSTAGGPSNTSGYKLFQSATFFVMKMSYAVSRVQIHVAMWRFPVLIGTTTGHHERHHWDMPKVTASSTHLPGPLRDKATIPVQYEAVVFSRRRSALSGSLSIPRNSLSDMRPYT